MSSSYLLDARVTETNVIGLRFLRDNGEIVEYLDNDYKPYFLTTCPLTEDESRTVRQFSGTAETVEKIDLFTRENRTLTRVSWPNPVIALKAERKFTRSWESHIDFIKSYVYDKGLAFGASHSKLESKPVLDLATNGRVQVEDTFREALSKDPLKYDQIIYWFNLLNQPIPSLPSEYFAEGIHISEEAYAAWMLSRVANLPLHEAFRSHHVSGWIKSIIHAYLRRNNILIPTSEDLRRGKPTHRVAGALTVPPIPGIYFNTVVCDFESLYASSIDSFNLSYETVDCSHSECKTNRIPDCDYHVCTKRRGFYSVLVGALKELRIRFFKPVSRNTSISEVDRKRATATSKLLKLLNVSSYGVTVRIHGLACPPLAEAITAYGRYVLRESWKMAETDGLRPLYGDTDSLFLDNPLGSQVERLVTSVKVRFGLDLAMEKRYNVCVLPKAKKAYFGILPDGTPDIKGVTPAKSNSPKYIMKVFEHCVKALSGVKNHEEYTDAKNDIEKIVSEALRDLRNRRVELHDLTYSVKLYFDPNEKTVEMKTSPQPYQCALQLLEAGYKLKQGDTVSFVKVKPFRYKDKLFTVKPVSLVKNLTEINMSDYERNLLSALKQTFDSMGIRFEKEMKTDISMWFADQN